VVAACGSVLAWPALASAQQGATVSAQGATPGDSASVALTIGARRVVRHDVLLGAGRRGTVVARVTTGNGEPHAGAQVWVDGTPPVRTSSTGLALLRDVPAGTQMVRARAIGMEPSERAVDIGAEDTARVALVLTPLPQLLATMRVTAILSGIEQRRALGKGYILMGDSLASRPLIASVVPLRPAFVTNENNKGKLYHLRLRTRLGKTCVPKVVLDGDRSSLGAVSSYTPQELAAVELYINFDDAPREYMRPSDSCGLLLVWTRRKLAQ